MAIGESIALVNFFITAFNFLKSNAKESTNWINEITQEKDFFGKAVKTYSENLEKRCGTLKILNMEKPIDLGQIYTSVNVLKKITARSISNISLLEEQVKNKGHFGEVREAASAIELINKQNDKDNTFNNIVILGKPGAGKTTFLRYTALRALKGKDGELKREVLPILVELRDLSHSNMTLMECIENQFDVCGISHKPFVKHVLSEGNCLILLDGLDEVKKGKAQELVREVKDIVDKYNKNQFVLTCRIAAYNYVFERFIDTEIADFNDEQIEKFVNQWFWPAQVEKSITFLEGLKGNKSIRELATTPLLLALMCMDYGERGVFPSNRSTLYRKCVETLLEKWDGTRDIYRDEIYKNLDSIKKELMFARIAAMMFEQEKIFLPEKSLSQIVGEFIKNLPSTKMEDLDVNSKQVVKSIEAQHGIFIERAEGIYSFSHLTFQEYFTAKYVVSNKSSLQNLVEAHLLKIRWKEVILLTSGLVGEADDFLLTIKRKVDSLATKDFAYLLNQVLENDELLKFVVESDKISQVINPFPLQTKITTLLLFCNYARDVASDVTRAFDSNLDFDRDLAPARDVAHALDYAPARTLDYERDLDFALDRADARARARACVHDLDRVLGRFLDLTHALAHVLEIHCVTTKACGHGLKINWLMEMSDVCSKVKLDKLTRTDVDKFNTLMGNAVSQIEKLNDYLYAINLLLECLKSDCYVSKETREKIMSELLTVPQQIQ